MATTKASFSLASGQTTSTTTSAADISTTYHAALGVTIVQVGTATTAASYYVQVSLDGGSTYQDCYGTKQAGIAAGTAADTYSWGGIPLDDAATHVRIVYTAQSGGTSSTLSAVVGKLTGI